MKGKTIIYLTSAIALASLGFYFYQKRRVNELNKKVDSLENYREEFARYIEENTDFEGKVFIIIEDETVTAGAVPVLAIPFASLATRKNCAELRA
jgi:hypothetical protein